MIFFACRLRIAFLLAAEVVFVALIEHWLAIEVDTVLPGV